jgi:hypothetical protein
MSRIDGFEARLRALFPAIGVLQPQGGETDLSLAHVLQAAALALQAQAGCPVTFARTTPTVDAGVYQVVVEYTEEAVGREAFQVRPGNWSQAALDGTSFNTEAAIADLRDLDEDVRLGPSTGSIVRPPWPVASPTAASPKAAWCSSAGVQAAPHLGGRGGFHQRRGRIHRPGQGPHQAPAARRRRARAAGPPGAKRGRSLGRGPGRSACRWWSSPRTATRARA